MKKKTKERKIKQNKTRQKTKANNKNVLHHGMTSPCILDTIT